MDDTLPTSPEDLFGLLKDLGICYELHHHKAVFSVAESESIEQDIPGTHCRNLFLRDKKKKMYLVVAANETAIDLKELQDTIGSARLSFGSPERLWENLGVRPGSVCPFAVINDTEQNIQVILDESMMQSDHVNYHPMVNTMTIALTPKDLLRFFNHSGHKPQTVTL